MQNTVYTETEKLVIGEEKPLVIASLSLPRLQGDGKTPFAKSFGAYYKALREGFLHYLEKTLRTEAQRASAEEGFKPFGAVINTVVSYDKGALLSLYADVSISTDKESRKRRIASTWRKDRGVLLKWRGVFRGGALRGVMPLLSSAAAEYSESPRLSLYSDWEKQLKKHFVKESFYLSPKGIVFFYESGVLSNSPKPVPLHLDTESILPLLTAEAAHLLQEE